MAPFALAWQRQRNCIHVCVCVWLAKEIVMDEIIVTNINSDWLIWKISQCPRDNKVKTQGRIKRKITEIMQNCLSIHLQIICFALLLSI